MSSNIDDAGPAPNQPKGCDVSAEDAEHDFIACMDSIQEYLQIQTKLQDQLKQGLLSIARAKYSMGPIGQAQYDMDMAAAVRITAVPAGDGSLGSRMQPASEVQQQAEPSSSGHRQQPLHCSFALRKTEPQAGKPPAAAKQQAAAADATSAPSSSQAPEDPKRVQDATGDGRTGGTDEYDDEYDNWEDSEDGEGEGGDEDEGLREATEFLRRMRMQMEGDGGAGDGGGPAASSGNAVGGQDKASAALGAEAGSRARRQPRGRRRRGGGGSDPLHWFGVLVPPALKEAQGQFAAVLDTCVQLANVAHQLKARTPPTVPLKV